MYHESTYIYLKSNHITTTTQRDLAIEVSSSSSADDEGKKKEALMAVIRCICDVRKASVCLFD